MAQLSIAAARRIALAAQGFLDARPAPMAATPRHLRRVVDRVQLVQIDSVNVVARSHYLPFYSRLGPYRTELLDGLRDGSGPRSTRPRELVEYVAHEASLLPASTWPLLGSRMRKGWGEQGLSWAGRMDRDRHGLIERVEATVREQGPMTSREAEAALQHDEPRAKDNWGWNWSVVKDCLEYLFRLGRLTSAGRNSQFERRYCAPELALPAEVVARGPYAPGAPSDDEAAVELVRISTRALGIGSTRCIADYFRIHQARAKLGIDALLASGELEQVEVDGWAGPLYLDAAAKRPRKAAPRALLSPFDSLIWQRERTEQLFGFRYRLEIYVPAPKRVYGYYVLPFLLDGELVGRVDLKADRKAGALLVHAFHLEPGAPRHARAELDDELTSMAGWLGLERVTHPRGTAAGDSTGSSSTR